jgi:TPR repeat protein
MKSRAADHGLPASRRLLWASLLLLSLPSGAMDLLTGIEAYQTQQYARAYEILMPHAQTGEAEAQRLIGVMYMLGQGVEQDLATAARWVRGSAQLGNPQAQELLSFMYHRGAGVPQDPVQAYVWLKLASQRAVDPRHSEGIQATIGRLIGQMTQAERQRARAMSRQYYYQYVVPFL